MPRHVARSLTHESYARTHPPWSDVSSTWLLLTFECVTCCCTGFYMCIVCAHTLHTRTCLTLKHACHIHVMLLCATCSYIICYYTCVSRSYVMFLQMHVMLLHISCHTHCTYTHVSITHQALFAHAFPYMSHAYICMSLTVVHMLLLRSHTHPSCSCTFFTLSHTCAELSHRLSCSCTHFGAHSSCLYPHTPCSHIYCPTHSV